MALHTLLSHICFTDDGLVPVIVQDYKTQEILMFAWMNRDALSETLATKKMCYWSRSRSQLWRKGERSGQVQALKSLSLDCDRDALLAQVEQTGVACHTGRKSCFFYTITDGTLEINQDVIIPSDQLYPPT